MSAARDVVGGGRPKAAVMALWDNVAVPLEKMVQRRSLPGGRRRGP